MKIRKFLFSFIDHDTTSTTEIAIDVFSNQILEWNHNENDLENNALWIAKNYIWEQTLKKQVKKIVNDKFFNEKTDVFADYRISKEKIKSDTEFVNMNHENSQVMFREKFLMEFNMVKFVKGTSPEKWTNMFRYDTNYHHLEYSLKSKQGDSEIMLTELSYFNLPVEKSKMDSIKSTKSPKSPKSPNSLASATKSLNSATKSTNKSATLSVTSATKPQSTEKANLTGGQCAMNNLTDRRDSRNNSQQGGDMEEKYLKYKKKYMNIKNK